VSFIENVCVLFIWAAGAMGFFFGLWWAAMFREK